MDYRCPVCGANLGKRKITQAVVVRMEMECFHCKSRIRLNVHRAEEIVVLLSFGTVVALAGSAYWFQSQSLMLTALGAAMLGALALPLLEQIYLRTWPRYAPSVQRPNP
jgi:DNA-directed RNA polymerase subunit RPC12/RpoP